NAKPIVEKLDVLCPECGKNIVVKKSKRGKKFFGCSGYPDCKFVSWNEPVKEKCPKCDVHMVKRYSKKSGNYVECSNKECDYKKELPKEELPKEENKN
ncbi:MAG TPA: topoisomerase DNA-binding C4 zinc finger domain-containing protein, partial [Clostridium sp.]